MTKPLTPPQRAMVEKINSFEWVRLDTLDISPNNTTLMAMRARGLLQMRTFHEVRLVATEQVMHDFPSAVQNLIDSLAPVVRRLLAKEIAAVQRHLNKEEGND